MGARAKLCSAMLIFSSVGLFVRFIDLSSAQIALFRSVIGALFLLLASLAVRRRPDFTAIWRNGPLLLFSGAALGFNWVCLFESYRYTTIAVSTLSYYLAPIFVIVLSPVVRREKITAVRGICAAIALTGMALVAGVFGGAKGGSNPRLGILFGILAAALYAAIVLSGKFFRSLSSMDCSLTQLVLAALFVLPYALLRGDGFHASPTSWVLLLLVGAVHTGLAYLLYFSSLRELSAQTAAVLSYIDPVGAVLLSALILREPMSPWQWLGASLVLGALLTSELAQCRKRP